MLKPGLIIGRISHSGISLSTDIPQKSAIFGKMAPERIDLSPLSECFYSTVSDLDAKYNLQYVSFLYCTGSLGDRQEFLADISFQREEGFSSILIGSLDIINALSRQMNFDPDRVIVDWGFSNLIFALGVKLDRAEGGGALSGSARLPGSEIEKLTATSQTILEHLSQYMEVQTSSRRKTKSPLPTRSMSRRRMSSNFRAENHAVFQLADEALFDRKLRNKFIEGHLFADPAWDMLLALMMHYGRAKGISTGRLCREVNIPVTTGLRWIAELEHLGFVRKDPDPTDARKVIISLSPRTVVKLKRYLLEIERRRTARLQTTI